MFLSFLCSSYLIQLTVICGSLFDDEYIKDNCGITCINLYGDIIMRFCDLLCCELWSAFKMAARGNEKDASMANKS